MLLNLVRFVVLIGALVFVHEFGHFVWAKIFGVKVLKFSLGFGARLLGWRRGETDYCISLIPIGGYVKMLGEDSSDPIAPEDAPRAFHNLSLWKRCVIVLAGPAMSLLFPLALYFVVFLGQSSLAPPVIGTVVPGYPAHGRLASGDRVLTIDGEPVSSFQEVSERLAESPGRALRFEVERDGRRVVTTVTPQPVRVERPMEVVERVGRAGVAAGFPLSVIGVRAPGTPAHVAGLRTFDMITMFGGRPIHRWRDLEAALDHSAGATVPVGLLRPHPLPGALGGLGDLEVFDPGIVQITPEPGTGNVAARTGIESPDLYVADVPQNTAEYQMGLRRGDRIARLDDAPPPSWRHFRESILEGGRRRRKLRFAHEGREAEGEFAIAPATWSDEFGQRFIQLAFHTDHWVPVDTDPAVPVPAPALYAARHAWNETGEALRFLTVSLVRIAQGRVSIRTVGGPIMIYEVSRSTASDGIWGFLWIMALVSVNLGLLNLLPIPTLDGGHIAFFLAEALFRRPVPLWVRQAASAAGLLVLLGVMVVAFKNDLERKLGRAPPVVISVVGN